MKVVHLRRVALGLAGIAAVLASMALVGAVMRFAPALLIGTLVAVVAYPVGTMIEQEWGRN